MVNRGDGQPEAHQDGLECPRCGCHHFEVTHTYRQYRRIRRRRVCRHCGRPVYTVEITAADHHKPPS